MAGYERNPKLQRRLAAVLAIAEALALTVNFSLVFMGYSNFLDAMMNRILKAGGILILTILAGAACLAAAVFVCRRFIKGAAWARWALVAANAIVVVLGVAWYLKVSSSGRPDKWVGVCGLMLPMMTLFPLLWPLMVFKPTSEPPAGAAAAPPSAPPAARSPAARLPPSAKPPEP